MSNDRKKLTDLWCELGIYWVDETEATEIHRVGYKLPETLEIGAVLGGPGISHYFFDAAGTYVGFGAMDVYEDVYFLERGRENPSPVEHDDDGWVRLEGRYIGVPKVHELSDEAGTLLHFRELPNAFRGGRFDGPGDFEEGDVLRVTLSSETVDYEVTRVVLTADEEGWELDARRIEENAKEGA